MAKTATKRAVEAAPTRQYLTFRLGEQEYGLELLSVQEIRGFTPITPIPNVPRHLRGVINLRGTVLPVIDLRMKFGLEEIEYTKFTVIVIASVGERLVGLIVDAVSDVLTAQSDEVQPRPDFGDEIDTRFVSGMYRNGDRLAILLELGQLLTESELDEPVPA